MVQEGDSLAAGTSYPPCSLIERFPVQKDGYRTNVNIVCSRARGKPEMKTDALTLALPSGLLICSPPAMSGSSTLVSLSLLRVSPKS